MIINQEQQIAPGNISTASKLTLKRPAATRLLAIAVLGMTLGFILFLGFLKSNTDLFGAAIGILLSLWGIRDVLLPGFVTWATIVDRFIVRCYLLLAFVLIARYTGRRVFRKDEAEHD